MSRGTTPGTNLKAARPYALFIVTLLADLVLGLHKSELGLRAFRSSAAYLAEMALVLPPIFVLIGILEVWVPREVIVRNVGPRSGVRGLALSVFAGSAAAGPLYAAFPVVESLLRKGCSVFNACVLLCTWAALKIPMILTETRFLGWRFSLTRLALTFPAVLIISWLVERLTPHLGGLCSPGQTGSSVPDLPGTGEGQVSDTADGSQGPRPDRRTPGTTGRVSDTGDDTGG